MSLANLMAEYFGLTDPYSGIPKPLIKVQKLMRECNYYEQLLFLTEQQDDQNSIRDQDYTVEIAEVPYRGILLNSGHAIVARSQITHVMNEAGVTYPRFFILEPGHASRVPDRSGSGSA